MSAREMAALSTAQIAEQIGADSVVVLPVGVIEQHGSHLPVSTDLLVADLLSARVVAAAAGAGLPVWRLPPLTYTKSDEHHWAAGTFWLEAGDLLRTVLAIARGVAATGARTLVFYNAHGGNTAALQVALRDIRRTTGLGTFLVNAAFPSGDGVDGADEQGLGIHAGHAETSVILSLRPELVDLSQAARQLPQTIRPRSRIAFNGGPVSFGWLSNDFGADGVIGDPTGASAAAGDRLVEVAVADGVAALEEIVGFWP